MINFYEHAVKHDRQVFLGRERRGMEGELRKGIFRAAYMHIVQKILGCCVYNSDGIVGDDSLVGSGTDKVKAIGERCRGRVMTTQRVVNAFMFRVTL